MPGKSMKKALTASNLKEALWDTLQQVRGGDVTPAQAGKVSNLAREVVRVLNTELQIMAKTKMEVSDDVRAFVGNDGEEGDAKPRRKAS